MLWLRELFNRKLKCDRIGHRTGIEYRTGYVYPESPHYHVCDKVRQERSACGRCKEPLGEWEVKTRKGYTGFSWPEDQADEFNERGEYWTGGGITAD